MKIAVRLDDIHPCMDYGRFLRVKEILDKYQVCPLIGVVPDNQDLKIKAGQEIQKYDQLLISLKECGWIIAMHGVTHKYLDMQNNKSEFCGLSYDEQYRILKRGMNILQERGGVGNERNKVFFAPSNHHDLNTEMALKQLGFTHLSYGENDRIFRKGPLLCIPIANGIRQVNRLMYFQAGHDGITTLVIHPNTTSEKLLKRYEKLLKNAYQKNMLVNYGDLLTEKAQEINEKWILNQRKIIMLESSLSRLKEILLKKCCKR